MKARSFILILISLILLSIPSVLVAQKKSNKIKIVNGAFNNKYYRGVWHISKESAYYMLRENGEAYNLVLKGEKLQKTGSTIAAVGGGLIGYTLGAALGGAEDPKWFIAGIGGGLVLLAIPIYSTGKKNTQMGAEVYNETLKSASLFKRRFIDEVAFVGTDSGIGLRVTF